MEVEAQTDERAPEFTRAAVGVVALCFVLNTLARGCGETFAVFYGPLLDEFGWGRGVTASLYSAFMVALGMATPVIGAVFDRYGGRAVYVGGLAAYGAGFLIASRMTELWHGWLGLGLLVGIGTAATGMTPATGIISRWFDRNMGFAISFAYAGLAFGSMLLAPLSGIMIEQGGWRWAYSVLGWGLLALGAVVLLLPWARIGRGVREVPVRPRSLLPDRRVLGRVPFWGLFLAFFMTSVATYAVQVQAVVYLEEAGYDRLTATLVFGANSMMSVVGILGAGWLSDRIGARLVATIAYALSIGGILALMALDQGPNPVLLALFLLGFGGAMGSRGPVVSSLTARLFQGQVGAVFGLVMIGLGLGGAFGAWAAGWLHEATGDYRAGLGLAILACLIGMGTFWAIPELARGRWRGT
jgi:MFS family permease